MKTIAVGLAAAAGLAGLLLLVTSGGEHGWKIAVALVGLVLWVLGGLSKT